MRICYLGDCTHIHDLRFVTKLVERGYDTHIVTFMDNPIEVSGVKYHSVPFPDLFFRSPRRLWRSKKILREILREIKPDVLHAGWIHTYGFLAAVSGFHPFLLMPWGSDILLKRDDIFSFTRFSIFNKVVSRYAQRYATRYAINKADMITCDAEHVKKEIVRLIGYPADRIIIFPWGIDLSKFNPEADGSLIRKRLGWEDNKILIMTRAFEPVYGIEYFLQALPQIIRECPEARAILCGDGSLRGELERFVKDKGLNEYVHFAGFVKNDDLPYYLASADVYVSCSLSDGTSLSLLEAMACGLPVVVSDVPAILEWVKDGENGFTVPVHDTTSLEQKIVYFLEREDLRENFGKRNWQIAQERANWDINFEKLEGIYRHLAEGRR
ncbi:glycosyltransferase family 4 protein [Chloroflexota bacterium]